MFLYQADKISEFEEEKARILRDIITSQLQKNFSQIQEHYGLEDEPLDEESILRGRKTRRDPENPYLVERRTTKEPEPERRRRKTDASSPMRGKY